MFQMCKAVENALSGVIRAHCVRPAFRERLHWSLLYVEDTVPELTRADRPLGAALTEIPK